MLIDELLSSLDRYQDSVMVDTFGRYTFKEFKLEMNFISKSLQRISNNRFKCAILCTGELNAGLSTLSCFKAGMIVIPLSLRYGSKHCTRILEATKPSIIIIDDISNLNLISNYNGGIYHIKDGLIKQPGELAFEKELLDVAMIICTSGTTGVPKSVMITYNNLWANLCDIKEYFKISKNDKILIFRPLYHCAVFTGEFLISICKGLYIHFYNDDFNPVSLLKYVTDNKISVLCGTPTLFNSICIIAKRMSLKSNIKVIAISGECMTKYTADIISETLPNTDVYNVYGLTEASTRVCYLKPDLFMSFPLSAGKPLNSIYAKIVDEKDCGLEEYMRGELIIKGPNIMKGYYKNEKLTKETIINGWLHTGDIAYKDKNGLIYIVSRKDNMMIRAGVNIYPMEIENALIQDSQIREVVAFGVVNSKGEQNIHLKVVLNDKNLTKARIYEKCKELLPLYQLPEEISIVENIERNTFGKLVRKNSERMGLND